MAKAVLLYVQLLLLFKMVARSDVVQAVAELVSLALSGSSVVLGGAVTGKDVACVNNMAVVPLVSPGGRLLLFPPVQVVPSQAAKVVASIGGVTELSA